MDELNLAPREASLAPDPPQRGAMTTGRTLPKQAAVSDRQTSSDHLSSPFRWLPAPDRSLGVYSSARLSPQSESARDASDGPGWDQR